MEYKNRIVKQLRNNEVFGLLTDVDLHELAALATRRSLEEDEILALQGSEWRAVLYIVSGLLRSVIQAPDGRRHVVTTWKAGEDFWSHTTFDGEPMLASLEAAKPTIVYQLSGEAVLGSVLRNQASTRALLHRQTQLIRQRRQNIYDLAFNQVTIRVAKLIADQFSASENDIIQRDFTLEDLAEMAATSPEVVCRTLSMFQSQGFLKLTRATITLQDRYALDELIGSEI